MDLVVSRVRCRRGFTEGEVPESLLRVELLAVELRDSLSPALSLPESKFKRVVTPTTCFVTPTAGFVAPTTCFGGS